MNNQLDLMVKEIRKKGYEIKGVRVKVEQLVFEERVKMNCFYCCRYNSNWKSPPKIPELDIPKMMTEFQSMAFIYIKEKIEDNFEQVRSESSVHLHRGMLECEKWLLQHDNSTALSFIGGSCKLCKNGCAPEKCANPYQARSPVEALGINVVESAKKCGIKIEFPVTEHIMRIGLLLW